VRGGTNFEHAVMLVLIGLLMTGVTLAFEQKVVALRRVHPEALR
jgi:hypothetical protein